MKIPNFSMRRLEQLLVVLLLVFAGVLLAAFAVLGMADLPDKSQLVTVSSDDILSVKHGSYKRRSRDIPTLCFQTPDWGCVKALGENAQYGPLLQAVEQRLPYAIAFIPEPRAMGERGEPFARLYGVAVNGRSVISFDEEMLTTRVVMAFVFLCALALMGQGIRKARHYLRDG